jgi:hypothetical protein
MINNDSTNAAPAKMPVRAALKWLALAAVLSISLLFSLPATAHAQDAQDDSFSDGDVIEQVEVTSPEPLDRLQINGVAPEI